MFDFVLLCIAIFDAWILPFLTFLKDMDVKNLVVAKVARLARVMRIMRVLQGKLELRMVVEGLMVSMRSMIWVALLLGVLIYIASILCVVCFGDVTTDCDLDFSTVP